MGSILQKTFSNVFLEWRVLYIKQNFIKFSTPELHVTVSQHLIRWWLGWHQIGDKPLTHLPLNKMAAISQTTCLNAFSWMKIFELQIKFHWNMESNWQYVSIGSDDGLASSRRQVIIWSIADPVHWRIYAALGGDELNEPTMTHSTNT